MRFALIFLLVCMMSVLTVERTLANIDPETIVGMWLFDDGDGEIVGDSSENGHDGTITGLPTWVDGKFGEALDVGGGNFVRVPHSEDLTLQSFTVTAWLQTQVGGAYIGVISKAHDNPTRNYTLYLRLDSNTASMSIGNEAGGNWSDKTGITPVNDGDWHHVAIMFDAETKVGKVFTDGVQEGQYTVAHDVPQGNADLVFAAWGHGGGNGGYIGLLDEIAIFNVALEEADIKRIMEKGLNELSAPVEPNGKLTVRWGAIKSIDF
ncbi:LamG domain-containing protein [Candidatus Poribacteria bacterium]